MDARWMVAMVDPVGVLDGLGGSATAMDLPPILPRFFIPPLTDQPQNPILNTLKLIAANQNRPTYITRLPPELSVLSDPNVDQLHNHPHIPGYNLWSEVITHTFGIRNDTLSWDCLRPSHPNRASSTSFLSEQDSSVFAAAAYHVNLRLDDPSTAVLYVTQDKLLKALKLTVLGTSSVFHTWDVSTERFTESNLGEKKRSFLLLDGKDEVITQSLISRFLTIGTLLRRLEIHLEDIRTRSVRGDPVVHAYAHALSTVISFLQRDLSRSLPINELHYAKQYSLSAIWMHYAIFEDTLVALADMCGRDEIKLPQDYLAFDPSPVHILSLIYSHLDSHLNRQSPRSVTALFAFLLTTASHEYHQQVSRSVGYGIDTPRHPINVTGGKPNQYPLDEDGEDKEDDLLHLLEISNPLWNTFPEYFPAELSQVLPAAQKSLVLLQAVQPDHLLLQRTSKQDAIKWYWTEALVQAAWNGVDTCARDEVTEVVASVKTPSSEAATRTQAEFSLFHLFDREPGSTLSSSTVVDNETIAVQVLQSFVDSFPESLPSITPSLSHITSLVYAPLVQHASTLSNALLTLFLSPSENNLNFQSHLHLLRSYLLLSAPSFKSRLTAALFSNSDNYEYDHKHHMSIRSLHQKSRKKRGEDSSTQPWAVGLSLGLLERETWPPVGADLSFFLRTVIVDSLERGKDGAESKDRTGRCVMEEAEYRLGFAIRDLPVVTGKDKWLNPLSIEALDFLYMDYKPPRPLEVLITSDILSKYQRVFAFILRLMRVENALGALFHMTRRRSKPLFATLAQSQKLLLHFRFVAQSFVSALSGYIFDTAIGGNVDHFIERLSSSNPDSFQLEFSDVFALAKSHSDLLDNVLSACLLRSGQRAVGELLRHSLELVLEFTIAVGELYRGRMEEYQAAPMLKELSQKFYTKMMTFTKVLKGLVDKNGSFASVALHQQGNEMPRKPTGGADALYQLYTRLDLGEWWLSNKR